jgi:hypothetical protein
MLPLSSKHIKRHSTTCVITLDTPPPPCQNAARAHLALSSPLEGPVAALRELASQVLQRLQLAEHAQRLALLHADSMPVDKTVHVWRVKVTVACQTARYINLNNTMTVSSHN